MKAIRTDRENAKLDAAMRTAKAWATLATCPRLFVGAVIMGPNFESIAWGFNGSDTGEDHCTDAGCDMRERDGRMSCHRARHAEENALRFALRGYPHGLPIGSIAVVTHHPCKACLGALLGAGVRRIFYGEPYAGAAVFSPEIMLATYGAKIEWLRVFA